MDRLYRELLKTDGSPDRASIMSEAWRIARVRAQEGAKTERWARERGLRPCPQNESVSYNFRFALRDTLKRAGTARRIILGLSSIQRAKLGYAEVDSAREWKEAA